jgi:hypothetical protein
MQPLSVFVPRDGYAVTLKIPGVPGLYPPCSIRYRPATYDVRLEYQNTPAGNALAVGCRLISERVQECLVRGDDGTEQPVTLRPEHVKELHADLFKTMLEACLGFIGPTPEENGRALFTASASNSPAPA